MTATLEGRLETDRARKTISVDLTVLPATADEVGLERLGRTLKLYGDTVTLQAVINGEAYPLIQGTQLGPLFVYQAVGDAQNLQGTRDSHYVPITLRVRLDYGTNATPEQAEQAAAVLGSIPLHRQE